MDKGAWLVDDVVVASDVTFGEGSFIGTDSVVTRAISPFVIPAGVPACACKRI